MMGREVKLLGEGSTSAGMHEARFDASTLPSGAYVYCLTTPQGSFSKMMQLIK